MVKIVLGSCHAEFRERGRRRAGKIESWRQRRSRERKQERTKEQQARGRAGREKK